METKNLRGSDILSQPADLRRHVAGQAVPTRASSVVYDIRAGIGNVARGIDLGPREGGVGQNGHTEG
jgi:hypothetical protein